MKRSGFTLIELLVVIAIIAILGSILAPKLSTGEKQVVVITYFSAEAKYDDDGDATWVFDTNKDTYWTNDKQIVGQLRVYAETPGGTPALLFTVQDRMLCSNDCVIAVQLAGPAEAPK